MVTFLNKSWAYVKMYSLLALFIAFTGGAAMALDPSVSNHALGVSAWTITILVIATWIGSYVTEVFFKPYKTWKESDLGKAIFVSIVFGLISFALLLVAIALGLH